MPEVLSVSGGFLSGLGLALYPPRDPYRSKGQLSRRNLQVVIIFLCSRKIKQKIMNNDWSTRPLEVGASFMIGLF